MNNRPNGIGGTTGDTLATCKPLQLAGSVWYLYSATGVDGASPAGKDRQKPLATLAQAHTNAAAGDIIVCLDGHTETLAATQVFSKAVFLIGEGSSAGKPTVSFRTSAANLGVFSLQAGVNLGNIYFPSSVQSNAGPGANVGKVHLGNGNNIIRGCYFEESAFDQLPGLSIATGLSGIRVENSTFISTATLVATRPTYGLYHVGTVSELDVNGCVFSDGTVGFSGAAWDGTAGIGTRMRAQSVSLLLGAEALHNAATTGFFNPQTATGGGRIDW